jgi:hypothetical protein
MTIRTVLNPYGGFPPIVDARIGTAYATVHIVALNLETITYVANNLDAVNVVYLNYPKVEIVADNMVNIVLCANNIAPINVVSNNIQAVKDVASDLTNVNLVATNVAAVNTVAADIDAVKDVAAMGQLELSAYTTGLTAAIGTPVNIPFPAGVTLAKLRGFSVLVHVLATGEVHMPGTKFTAFIVNNQLRVTVSAGATDITVGSTILWHMTYAA